jgi:hypothetical protein
MRALPELIMLAVTPGVEQIPTRHSEPTSPSVSYRAGGRSVRADGSPPAGAARDGHHLHVCGPVKGPGTLSDVSASRVPPHARRRRARAGRRTTAGRPARTRRLKGQSADSASPGSGATLPEPAQTFLSRDQHGQGDLSGPLTATLPRAMPYFNGGQLIRCTISASRWTCSLFSVIGPFSADHPAQSPAQLGCSSGRAPGWVGGPVGSAWHGRDIANLRAGRDQPTGMTGRSAGGPRPLPA